MRDICVMCLAGIGLTLLAPSSARADDCILDTNNDGAADSNVDRDLGADSEGRDEALACGMNATARGVGATAVGWLGFAGADGSAAFGPEARASAIGALALGQRPFASGDYSAAVGFEASASGLRSMALGYRSGATNLGATAIGGEALAKGDNGTAVGRQATTGLTGATAVGYQANAAGVATTVVGYQAQALANSAVAIGRNALAAHGNSVAIGRNATSTASNQVTLGGTGSSVRIGDIGASTIAQVGPVDVVTIDANGTLGRGAAASAASLDRLNVAFRDSLLAHEADIAALDRRVGLLESDMDGLEGGIAAAAALGSAIPLAHDGLTLSINAATHGSAQAIAGSLTGRIGDRLALGGGLAGNSGDGKVTAQVGVSIGL